ncbi:snare associated Golgi protein-domain-containing protein [Gongronella butleri]|nr:snare associated Golgi protein-domain-containing protein [Gongronella butleri]
MGAVMVAYRKEFFDALEALSQAVKTMGLSGYFLIAFLIFLSAFPPMIGYGTFQTLSGFTFGFAKGFPVSYFGALAGAVSCFVLSRYFLHRHVLSLMNRYPNLAAVVRAVEKKGFKLFLLIRLSPYPFNLLNVLFAASDISLVHYTLGTAISLIKIALHVYIGANLTSFTKHLFGEDDDLTESERQAQTVMEVGALIGSILAMGVMVYVYVVAKRAIKEVQHESDEQRAFLGDDPIAMEEAGITDDWVDWNESDDDDDIALRRRHSLDHASPR